MNCFSLVLHSFTLHGPSALISRFNHSHTLQNIRSSVRFSILPNDTSPYRLHWHRTTDLLVHRDHSLPEPQSPSYYLCLRFENSISLLQNKLLYYYYVFFLNGQSDIPLWHFSLPLYCQFSNGEWPHLQPITMRPKTSRIALRK